MIAGPIKMQTVFLLGCNERATLSFLRSLSKRDCEVTVVSTSRTCAALSSRFIHESYIVDENLELEELKDRVFAIVPPGAFVVPMNDFFLTLIRHYFEEFRELFVLPYGDVGALDLAVDKLRTSEIAREVLIKTPKVRLVRSYEDIKTLKEEEFSFPVIVKPRHSAVVVNRRITQSKVKKVDSFEDLRLELVLNIENGSYMIQNYIPGHGKALNIFAVEGEIHDVFQYERLHEPGFGGGSSYRRSVELSQDVFRQSQALISSIGYTGLAMIEFRYSPEDGQYYFMEINARPWGSISLPIFAGMDFPTISYDYFIEGSHQGSEYEVGVYTRNLMKDVKWQLRNARSGKVPRLFKELRDFISRGLGGIESFDVFRFEDRRPALSLIYRTMLDILRKGTRRILGKGLLLRAKLLRTSQRKRVCELFASGLHLCFVCRGNIIRSAFAEKYFNKISASSSDSCGTIRVQGRRATPVALEVARNMEIDLSQHLSKNVHHFLNQQSKYVFLTMDEKQAFHLKHELGFSNVYMLGVLGDGPLIVRDPYAHAHDPQFYEEIFGEIRLCIDRLLEQ